MKFRTIPVILILFLLFAGSGCTGKTEPVRSEFFCMDTVMQVILYPEKDEDLSSIPAFCEKELHRVDALLVNAMGSMDPADSPEKHTSPKDRASALFENAELTALLDRALTISVSTDGAFDPTLWPVMNAWGFYTGNYRVPDDAELSALLRETGWEKARAALDSADPSALPVLDFGAIGKGYAAAVLKEQLREKSLTSAILSLGGNVSLLGSKPDGSDFTVGIQDPEKSGSYFATVSLSDCAVVTSGSYERSFEKDGVRYSHIIDPKTGHPVDNSLLSVTIITDDDLLADALSTALFVMGCDDAVSFYRNGPYDFDMILMEKDRSITITEGLEDIFRTTESTVRTIRK